MVTKIAAGNWKMNGLAASLDEIDLLLPQLNPAGALAILCPPATLLAQMAARADGGALLLGGQDCHVATSGAHTGDISAAMLRDAGAQFVILGHSERRSDHNENNADVAAKTRAAWNNKLTAIVCVGETEAERDAGVTLQIIAEQLEGSLPDETTPQNTVIAYEPVWAIGTGRTPTLNQIAEVHDFMRSALSTRFGETSGGDFSLLYGGSVKPGNAADIFAVSNVNGALIGGASLKASDFIAIWNSLSAS